MRALAMMGLYALFSANPKSLGVHSSVIPLMEKMESVEDLSYGKYAPKQKKEIVRALERKSKKIRAASYNILFDIKDDLLEENYRWPKRLSRLVKLIKYMKLDVFGVQEPYFNQIQDLLPFFQEEFAFFTKDSIEGEINGLFYRRDRFDLLSSHVWSMTTGDLMMDTLTMVCLKDRLTGLKTAFFNTHLSYPSIEKRENQVFFILDKIQKWSRRAPIVLMGDFNSFPNRRDLETLPFYDGDYIERLLSSGCLKNAKQLSLLGHIGPMGTYTNKGVNATPFKGYGTPGVFLDRIYVSKEIKVLIHAIEAAKVEGYFPSDHMPVVLDFLVDRLF